MPTAAKAVSAILFAALAWQIAQMIIPLLPEGKSPGRMVESSTFFGFLVGWNVVGAKVGKGFSAAFGVGLTGIVSLVSICLAFNSFWQMLGKSLKRRYDGPMDAFAGFIDFIVENATMIATPEIITLALVGGIVIGLVAEAVSKVAK